MRRFLLVLPLLILTGGLIGTSSAVAGTPANECSDNQQVTPQVRILASANPSRQQCLTRLLHTGTSKLRFYQNHRWTLAPRYAKWWDVPSQKRRNIARLARSEVRYYTTTVAWAQRQLAIGRFKQWLSSSFACIHGYEGAWNDNTGNGYYGGLQMDINFQQSYGPEFLKRWGTANNWPIWAQLTAASRAYLSGRGFGPWPKTSVDCGLPLTPLSPLDFSV